MGNVRFAKVVASCGKPEVYLLWMPAKKDAELQKAIAANRVMMIHQELVGTKQDFGEVGFQEGVRGQILVFPKTLASFRGKRVVGIQYDALAAVEEPETPSAAAAEDVPVIKTKTAKKEKPKPPKATKPIAAPEPKPAPREEPKLIPFIPAAPPEAADDEEAIHTLRDAIQRAIDALEEGRHVAAYQILQRTAPH